MEFKKSLKKFRTDNNLTQDELGKKLGISGKVISKWESGYTMPDIEKIKTLCEVFNCEYADLIGPESKSKSRKKEKIEPVKEEVAKEKKIELNIGKTDSKFLKCISGLLYFLAKIMRIGLYIGVVFVVLCMVILPSIVNMVNVNNNEISIRDFKDDVYYITKDNTNKYVLMYNDRFLDADIDYGLFNKVTNIFNNYSKNEIITTLESSLVIVLISITVLILVFYNLELLLNNIHDKDTPFIKENIHYLGMISCLLIAVRFCEFVVSLLLAKFDMASYSSIEILDIVFLLIMVYVFKYGYNLQSTVNSKIYYEIKD